MLMQFTIFKLYQKKSIVDKYILFDINNVMIE